MVMFLRWLLFLLLFLLLVASVSLVSCSCLCRFDGASELRVCFACGCVAVSLGISLVFVVLLCPWGFFFCFGRCVAVDLVVWLLLSALLFLSLLLLPLVFLALTFFFLFLSLLWLSLPLTVC